MPRRIVTSIGAIITTMMLMMAFVGITPASANHENDGADHEFADDDFWETWARTDLQVANDTDEPDRTWIWGPEPFTGAEMERYDDSPGGERLVQYFDKSRMEINDPNAFDDDLWYVTNGLLVVEMVEGRIQVGDAEFVDEPYEPAEVNIVGDPTGEEGMGPTYADISRYGLQDEEATAEGTVITTHIDGEGEMTDMPGMADEDVTAAHRVTVEDAEGNVTIDHTVASVFWEFMNSTGTVFIEDEDAEDEGDIVGDGQLVTEELFENAFYATGYPITEAYWTTVMVNAQERDVLWQCFERRCLTYTPGNTEGFAVEAGNVGQHYYKWRYADDEPEPEPEFPAEQLFHAHLMPADDDTTTDAEGHVFFLLTDDGETVRFWVELHDITGVTGGQLRLTDDDATTEDVMLDLFDGDDLVLDDDGDDMTEDDDYTFEGEIVADDLEGMTLWSLVEMMIDGNASVHIETGDADTDDGAIHGDVMVADNVEIEAHLNGDNEVPPVDTDATGMATFTYMNGEGDDASELSYSLELENIDNVTMAHIHLGDEGETGPPVAPLFSSETPVTPNAPITGTITADELLADLEDASLETLVFEMVSRGTYVNVHTTDFLNGEVRGQTHLAMDDEPAPEPEPMEYRVQFGSLNGSGVSGMATLSLDGNDLTVTINASGLEPGQVHPQHIHGFAACDPDDATVECGLTDVPAGPSTDENAECPPVSASGEDQFITLAEGAPFYGNILLPLTMENGNFPTADAGGNVTYSRTFDLTNEQLATLGDLTNNVIVLHGMTVDLDDDDTTAPTYEPTLPVACGEVEPEEDGTGGADFEVFTVDFDELNDSNVDGTAIVTRDGNMVTVTYTVTGLEDEQLHPQHIHGFGDTDDPGQDSDCPPMSLAGDDGILILEEGASEYGPIMLPLMPFPTAPALGDGETETTVSFEQSYFIDADEFGSLELKTIILHGMTVDMDGEAGAGEAEYVASLPVACGELEPVNAADVAHAEMINSEGETTGMATLVDTSAGITVVVSATGLEEGLHGLHIHTVGSCVAPDFASAGGHFNPTGTTHPNHAGDLPNLMVDSSGQGIMVVTTDRIGSIEVLFDDDGSAIVIHADEDDMMTDPTGNSGTRVACGVITMDENE